MCVCVCVCGMCDVRPLTGARLSVRDFTAHTHTPKGSRGRRGSHKASNSPSLKLVLLSFCVSGEGRGGGGVLCLTGADQTTLGHKHLTRTKLQQPLCKQVSAVFFPCGVVYYHYQWPIWIIIHADYIIYQWNSGMTFYCYDKWINVTTINVRLAVKQAVGFPYWNSVSL